MNGAARAATVLLVGAVLIQLFCSGAYLRYVRPEMGWLLLTTGCLLAGLGLYGVVNTLLSRRRGGPAQRDGLAPDHDTCHSHGAGVAWLLLAATLALLVAPPALGSYSLDRTRALTAASVSQTFAPLPAGETARMTLREFTERAADNDGANFGDTAVRLTGFVAGIEGAAKFQIARYTISCCAADAAPAMVTVTGATTAGLSTDDWVTVTGAFRPPNPDVATHATPELHASTVTRFAAPETPYE